MDVESNKGAEKYLASADVTQADLPLVILKDGSFIKDPSLPDLATGIGLAANGYQRNI